LIPASRSVPAAAWVLPLAQLGVGLLLALLAAVLAGWQAAPAVAVGAAVIAAGFALFGWRTQARSGVVSARHAFARLLLGTALKWLAIGAGLALAMSSGRFEPQFVLVGAVGAYLAYPLCLPRLLK
jgi:hypothetical protein